MLPGLTRTIRQFSEPGEGKLLLLIIAVAFKSCFLRLYENKQIRVNIFLQFQRGRTACFSYKPDLLDMDLPGVAPQALQAVKFTIIFVENMDNHITEIHQNPTGILITFHPFEFHVVFQ
ncbi:hypothetical protein ATH33_1130 [Thermoactinomyces vulgaris]|nr:hypothetical protein ATH33_1130 [Thermoactinomyces vulgaris]